EGTGVRACPFCLMTRRWLQGAVLLAPLSLFIAAYLAVFLFTSWITRQNYWSALAAAAIATLFTNIVIDRAEWRIGFFVRPKFLVREAAIGVAFAVVC